MPRSYGITNVAPYSTAPAVGAAGDEYYNTTSKTVFVSDGTAWADVSRTYAVRYKRLGAFTFSATPNTLQQPFVFDTKETVAGTGAWDTSNAYSTSTGIYTCPIDGIYLVEGRIGVNLNASGQLVQCSVFLNNTAFSNHLTITAQTAAGAFGCLNTVIVSCVAGDQISIGAGTSLASGTVRNNIETHIAVARIGLV